MYLCICMYKYVCIYISYQDINGIQEKKHSF